MGSPAIVKQQMLHKYLGMEFKTSKSGKCFIVDYVKTTDVTVIFYEPFCIVKCRLKNLKTGKVSNPLLPTVHNIGYMGIGKFNSKNNSAYSVWGGMFTRAYNTKFEEIQPTYKDVVISRIWWDFQNFAEWCYRQQGFNERDDKGNKFQLDKDILVKGNKIYSPETCCFVPQEINTLLLLRKSSRGCTPVGVRYVKKSKKYISSIIIAGLGRKYLGSYDTSEEAFKVYKEVKESHIKEVAKKWEDKIDPKVYEALIDFEICIDD